mmetsp:Transcript_39960/g.115148  ORF Transcript_39960/g.115148 Transcript_39960/m.115148 type:complete len:213 (-) Transcript_39960:85-723(-)
MKAFQRSHAADVRHGGGRSLIIQGRHLRRQASHGRWAAGAGAGAAERRGVGGRGLASGAGHADLLIDFHFQAGGAHPFPEFTSVAKAKRHWLRQALAIPEWRQQSGVAKPPALVVIAGQQIGAGGRLGPQTRPVVHLVSNRQANRGCRAPCRLTRGHLELRRAPSLQHLHTRPPCIRRGVLHALRPAQLYNLVLKGLAKLRVRGLQLHRQLR